ncbi:hypothetical protein NDU88_004590 [Pleurodeles waltl]|uniref:Uncharacterized protein n=1 Tax=Pleurodeles waltl TaxID=8319 RepID=A0AAV7RJQ3_PLEWA|nr:hypothetical protein NDU88_004590 [Pleurodeles waltl]
MTTIVVRTRHILGWDNSVADAVSHFQCKRFRELARHTDLHMTQYQAAVGPGRPNLKMLEYNLLALKTAMIYSSARSVVPSRAACCCGFVPSSVRAGAVKRGVRVAERRVSSGLARGVVPPRAACCRGFVPSSVHAEAVKRGVRVAERRVSGGLSILRLRK